MTTATANPFRFQKPTREDLPRLARLAYDHAAIHCGACRNYHSMWPYLRAVGVSGLGPEFDWELQLGAAMRAAAGRKEVRWMLAGSADAGKLGLVGAVIDGTPAVRHRVTLVDRCTTPLAVCRAHADAVGIDLETVADDLLGFSREAAFDVVMVHYTLNFVDVAERPAFLARASGWLAPGGRLWLAAEYDPPDGPMGAGVTDALRAWRAAVIREEAASGTLAVPEPIDAFLARLRMRDPAITPVRQTRDQCLELVTGAGLDVLEVVELPFGPEAELYGTAPRSRCIILAGKSSSHQR